MSEPNSLQIPCPTGQVSDGLHTFDELYDHRCTLFLALMKCLPSISWFRPRHSDTGLFEGWFIAGIELPTGQVTYHLPNAMLGLAQESGAKFLEFAPEWDKHTPADVITRIRKWMYIK